MLGSGCCSFECQGAAHVNAQGQGNGNGDNHLGGLSSGPLPLRPNLYPSCSAGGRTSSRRIPETLQTGWKAPAGRVGE